MRRLRRRRTDTRCFHPRGGDGRMIHFVEWMVYRKSAVGVEKGLFSTNRAVGGGGTSGWKGSVSRIERLRDGRGSTTITAAATTTTTTTTTKRRRTIPREEDLHTQVDWCDTQSISTVFAPAVAGAAGGRGGSCCCCLILVWCLGCGDFPVLCFG
jgi:hypothetical protein